MEPRTEDELDDDGTPVDAGDDPAQTAGHAAPDSLLGHHEAYYRAALDCREPIRQATDDYRALATTVGHGRQAADDAPAVDPLERLDTAQREAVAKEAERITE